MTEVPRSTSVRRAKSGTVRRCVRAPTVPASTGPPRRRRRPEPRVRRPEADAALSMVCLLPLSGFSTCGPRAPITAHTSSGDATGKIRRRGDRDRPRRWTALAPGGAAAAGTAGRGHRGGGRADRRLRRSAIGHNTCVIPGVVGPGTRRSATGDGDRTSDRADLLGRTARPACGQLVSGRGSPGRGPGDPREQGS